MLVNAKKSDIVISWNTYGIIYDFIVKYLKYTAEVNKCIHTIKKQVLVTTF